MKKPTLNFGQFTQYDKVFITEENGIDLTKALSVAFEGETLYIADGESLAVYTDGKIKKTQAKVSKLFTRNSRNSRNYRLSSILRSAIFLSSAASTSANLSTEGSSALTPK